MMSERIKERRNSRILMNLNFQHEKIFLEVFSLIQMCVMCEVWNLCVWHSKLWWNLIIFTFSCYRFVHSNRVDSGKLGCFDVVKAQDSSPHCEVLKNWNAKIRRRNRDSEWEKGSKSMKKVEENAAKLLSSAAEEGNWKFSKWHQHQRENFSNKFCLWKLVRATWLN